MALVRSIRGGHETPPASPATEMIAVPAASLRRKPEILGFDQAASVGVNDMAAWCGLEAAVLKAGERVLLIDAGGGFGGAAAQIAQRLRVAEVEALQASFRFLCCLLFTLTSRSPILEFAVTRFSLLWSVVARTFSPRPAGTLHES